jgi:hypothetical protein
MVEMRDKGDDPSTPIKFPRLQQPPTDATMEVPQKYPEGVE